MLISVLQHVPPWVFVLLVALIALGVSQSFPRTVSLRRTTVLPLVLLGLSLQGVVATFGARPLALLAWAAGIAGGLAAMRGRGDLSAVHYSADAQTFRLPGSWLPLALMLGLFALKFGAGVALGVHPELRDSTGFAFAASTVYGGFSGIFLGRVAALWALARRAASPIAAPAARAAA